MLRSMTGYGRGEKTLYERKFVVEIKSVNHRYNDISVKLPRVLNQFEDYIKKTISQSVFRGKADVYISMKTFSKNDIKVTCDENLADAYFKEIKNIDDKYNFNQKNYLNMILSFPDVLTVENSIIDDNSINEMKETLDLALSEALERLTEMREREGVALKNDLLKKSEYIEELANCIEEKASIVAKDLRERLLAKVKDILGDIEVDETRLLTEVTIQAEKICIDEEIIRLKSHISQLRNILNEDGIIGRKLDFLIQEMNRETNTIGSKSNDLSVTNWVVLLKTEIEKVREQIQNIE